MRNMILLGLTVITATGMWYYSTSGADKQSLEQSSIPDKGNYRVAMPETVTVEAIKFMEIVDTIESIGTTHANESVAITSKVTETVSQVHFSDGDHVNSGQILVEMTNSEESALLAEAQANLDEARRQLNRQLDLGEKGLAAKSIIDEVIAREEAVQARFNAIAARMNDRLIRAPFDGILGFREISPGTLLTSNTVITTLDDISVIKLDFSVPEIYLGTITKGFKIISRSDSWKDREFEGVIDTIGSRIDPVTRAVMVRAKIDNPEELLRPGMMMTVKIITDARQSLVIPESAFIQTGKQSYVFIAGEDGLAHRQPIRIGARRYGYVEVLEGLQPGQLVITEGGFKLRDKAPYRIDEASELDLSLIENTSVTVSS
ncbi:MAG: efflux RND transporter periplasmic adaptor subunit [Gammaproteobacteria bacterium]|nr:efflux RND transporter periplasmic adaptor subunit [Gammaproteobacteria bacterium]